MNKAIVSQNGAIILKVLWAWQDHENPSVVGTIFLCTAIAAAV